MVYTINGKEYVLVKVPLDEKSIEEITSAITHLIIKNPYIILNNGRRKI